MINQSLISTGVYVYVVYVENIYLFPLQIWVQNTTDVECNCYFKLAEDFPIFYFKYLSGIFESDK